MHAGGAKDACIQAKRCLQTAKRHEFVLQDARRWLYLDTDYLPMVEVAKLKGLPVIYAEAPSHYATLINDFVSCLKSTTPEGCHRLHRMPGLGQIMTRTTGQWSKLQSMRACR